MTWADKTPSGILADLNAVLVGLPPLPDISKIYVNPQHWALLQSWQLYWRLRREGVHWRRAKRLRRREWERLKREVRRPAPPPPFSALGFDYMVQQQLDEFAEITNYLATH